MWRSLSATEQTPPWGCSSITVGPHPARTPRVRPSGPFWWKGKWLLRVPVLGSPMEAHPDCWISLLRCPYVGDNYQTQLIPVQKALDTPFPSYYKRFSIFTFSFVDTMAKWALRGPVWCVFCPVCSSAGLRMPPPQLPTWNPFHIPPVLGQGCPLILACWYFLKVISDPNDTSVICPLDSSSSVLLWYWLGVSRFAVKFLSTSSRGGKF